MRFLQRYKPWVVELIILHLVVAAGTAVILAYNLDLRLASGFYDEGWPLKHHPAVMLFYRFAPLPALLIAVLAALIFLAALFEQRFATWRRTAIFLVLVYIAGPGLIVNSLLKSHWGRPRPADTAQFSGTMAFREMYDHGTPGKGKSFPSGHASAAFYLAALYCVLRARKMRGAYAALAGGIAFGALAGIARMAAGGHYASDILWAGYFTLLTAFLFAPMLEYETGEELRDQKSDPE